MTVITRDMDDEKFSESFSHSFVTKNHPQAPRDHPSATYPHSANPINPTKKIRFMFLLQTIMWLLNIEQDEV